MAPSLIDIDEILECPICFSTPSSTPIHQCVMNGHIICNTCVARQGMKCPICRSVEGFSRCLTAEKLWREFQKNPTGSTRLTASPFNFIYYGCVFVCLSVLSGHQKDGIHRRAHCPVVTCHYGGEANEVLVSHFENDHSEIETYEFSDTMIFGFRVKEDHWKTVTTYKLAKFEAYSHVFYLEVRRDEFRKSWSFWVYFDGTPMQAHNLIAEIRLLTPNKEETIISHNDHVVPLDDGLPEVLDKYIRLVLSDDFMKKKIVRNGEFSMSITVRRQQ